MTTETNSAHAAAIHNRIVLQARGEPTVESDVHYARTPRCPAATTTAVPLTAVTAP
jgi:hypothetical protein